MNGREVRVLSFHASYRCRNSGACCTANWPIPIEADRLARLQAELATGALKPPSQRQPFEIAPDAPSETPALLAVKEGRCVFHDPSGTCEIHKALGHDALPLACRQFPRISVADPRGVSVTLSHYCPTAARLLEQKSEDIATAIVTDANGFPRQGEYVGLDATNAPPPLLRPGMLMDWESWWEIERLSVDALLTRGRDGAEALGLVRGAVDCIRGWSPGALKLIDEVRRAFDNPPARPDSTSSEELLARAARSVPEAFRSQARWTTTRPTENFVIRRFLAAHAFANWAIHLGQGLESWLLSIETAHAFLKAGAGVRHADLVLRHLADHAPEHPST